MQNATKSKFPTAEKHVKVLINLGCSEWNLMHWGVYIFLSQLQITLFFAEL